MHESRLPWWLVLLLGVWIAALSVWGSSRASREVRWGAGLLSLVYLALIFLALGRDLRALPSAAVSRGTAVTVSHCCMAITMLAGVCLLGHLSRRGRLMWFILLTVANGANCFAIGAVSVGGTLWVAAIAVGIVLIREQRRDGWPLGSEWLRELIPISPHAITREVTPPMIVLASTRSELAGATGFVLALLLLGTLGYAMRSETSRAVTSHRLSALPSADRIREALKTGDEGPLATCSFELLLDRRADVTVLLAVLVFLALAMHHRSRHQHVEAVPHDGTTR